MIVTLHQIEVSESKEENLERALKLLGRFRSDLDVFPEYLMGVGEEGVTREYVRRLAEPLDGPFVSAILEKSKREGKAVVFTMYLLEGDKVYNAAVLADRGGVRAVYRKVHLFDAFGYKESDVFSPGSEVVVGELGDIKVGLAVCFDLRFPELFRGMAKRGASIFVVPAAWYRGPYKLDQWRALTTARAHENTCFLIAVNQTGKLFSGHSLVVSPLGYIVADLGEEERSIPLHLPMGDLEKARRMVPVLKLLRDNIY